MHPARRGRPRRGFRVRDAGRPQYAKPRVQMRIKQGEALRGGAVAVRATGAGLGALGVLATEWARVTSLSPAVKAEWQAFCEARLEYGDEAGSPVTTEALAGYLVSLCVNGVASQTLAARLSHLLAYIRLEGPPQEGLDAEELRSVGALLPRLARSFPGTIVQMLAVTDEELLKVVATLEPHCARGSLFALEWRAMVLLARTGMLRSCDYLAPAMLATAVRVVVAGTGAEAHPTVRIELPYFKSQVRAFNPRTHTVTLPRDGRFGGRLDFYPALLAYAAAAGIQLGRTEAPLFPRYKRTANAERGRVAGRYRYAAALEDWRWLLRRAGVSNVERIGMHSLRASGATLYLVSGVPREDVQRLGLWSDPKSVANYDRRDTALAAAATARLKG